MTQTATNSALPTHMRAMEISLEVGPGQLVLAQMKLPEIAPEAVLIRVAYAGVNRADVLQVAGSYAPPPGASARVGLEVSGTIAAIGSEVSDWQIGDAVCALLSGGGYAEYVAAPAAQLLPIPAGVSLREAASLPEAAATSVMALALEANLQAGERVLLHGGTSGVGLILAQIAHAWGAEVFATVGSAEKANFLRGFEIHPINHRTAPFGEQVLQATHNEGVDVVVDILGAPALATHLKLLRRGGRMVSLAMMEGNVVEPIKIAAILTKNLHWSGAMLRGKTQAQKAEIIALVAARVWPQLGTGAIRPVIDSSFPLAAAEKAHQRMQERLHMGKILLEVAP